MSPPAGPLTGPSALGRQLWDENPIVRQVLGICSSLAVTNLLVNTALMCLGLLWATAMSSLTVSLLRHYIPTRVRMMVQVLIIAVYVILVDIVLRAQTPDIHKMIGPYVGLIITNCIVMGRLEAFASKNRPWASLCDGVGAGLGYSFVLLAVAFVREYLGFGTLFGAPVPTLGQLTASAAGLLGATRPEAWNWWTAWTLMIMPPGAFFVLALAVWAARSCALRRAARGAAPASGGPAPAGGTP